MSVFNLRNVCIGLLATLTMDILTGCAIKLSVVAPLSPHLIGRWFISVARGQLFHTDIAQVSPSSHEVAIALPVHYAIGITLALLYLFSTSVLGLIPRNPIAAVSFALCTSLLPWLLMFPAMGYGWFGAQGPPGTRLFVSSLVIHGFYGVGLWLSVLMLGFRPRLQPS